MVKDFATIRGGLGSPPPFLNPRYKEICPQILVGGVRRRNEIMASQWLVSGCR